MIIYFKNLFKLISNEQICKYMTRVALCFDINIIVGAIL